MAEVVEAVISGLGYQSYIVSAGDVGSGVAEALAVRAPHRVSALAKPVRVAVVVASGRHGASIGPPSENVVSNL